MRCNQFIKFDALWPKARALDADYIATGHYARVEYLAAEDRYLLRQAVDARKDQSYVLYPLDQEHLARTLLPLGGYRKDEIRALARELDLIVAGKPESQEICFINHGHYSDSLAERFPSAMRPGPLVNVQGVQVGEHAGIGAYTVGQRKGLGVALNEPSYVVRIESQTNTVVVGPERALYTGEVLADELMLTSVRALEPAARSWPRSATRPRRCRRAPTRWRATASASSSTSRSAPSPPARPSSSTTTTWSSPAPPSARPFAVRASS